MAKDKKKEKKAGKKDKKAKKGHDISALQKAFAEAAALKDQPTVIIAHTTKGKGVSFMENNPKFHGTAPTVEEEARALAELA